MPERTIHIDWNDCNQFTQGSHYCIFIVLCRSLCHSKVQLYVLILQNTKRHLHPKNYIAKPLTWHVSLVVVFTLTPRLHLMSGLAWYCHSTRVKFMLEVLLAIKNNNMTKIPNYDPSHSEHLKKLMKGFLHKGICVTELRISLDDLLKGNFISFLFC